MDSKFWWKNPDGTFRLISMAEFQQAMAELPDHRGDHVPPPNTRALAEVLPQPTKANKPCKCGKNRKRGLGDVVKAVTNALGFKTCAACEARRKRMNAWTPGWVSRMLGGRVKQRLPINR